MLSIQKGVGGLDLESYTKPPTTPYLRHNVKKKRNQKLNIVCK